MKVIEHFVDRSIPFMVVLLGILIIGEFTVGLEHYEPYVTYADYVIVGFFVLDLVFKWWKTRKFVKFVRLYWLDILAVFPFYLFFRVYLAASELAKLGEEAQKVTHEALLLREVKVAEEMKVLRTFEMTSREARLSRIGRLIRFAQRSLRFLRARVYVAYWHLMYHKRRK